MPGNVTGTGRPGVPLPAIGPEGARVFTAGGIRELDADLERHGLLELTMEHAGIAVADITSSHYPGAHVLVVAGGGANGADALVAARHLHARGHAVTVLALPTTHPLAMKMRDRLAPFVPIANLDEGALAGHLPPDGVILDGLLGTGVRLPLRPETAALVRAINAAEQPTVSIDLPSGMPADTGPGPDEDDAPCVRADLTVALAGLKPAHLLRDCGEVRAHPIGIPRELLDRHALAVTLDAATVRAALPVRERGAHKGTAGKVWVIGGTPGRTGAPAMTALAALRTGAGLVTVHSRGEVPQHPVEAMTRLVQDWRELRDLPKPDAVAIGMGLGEEAATVTRSVLELGVSAAIDADALQPELAGPEPAGRARGRVVWTPHPGEAARMLGTRTADVTRDPFSAARELQERYGGAVVLKGGPTIVATPGQLHVCLRGNPGMASGGTGDVLTGVIAALLGMGLGADAAATAGVYLHAHAGDRASRHHGYGTLATDLAGELGRAWLDVSMRGGQETP